jgi:hypothetical protein
MSNQEDLPQNENMQNINEQQLKSVTGGGFSIYPKLKPVPVPVPSGPALGKKTPYPKVSQKPTLPTISESPAEGQDVQGVNHGGYLSENSRRQIALWHIRSKKTDTSFENRKGRVFERGHKPRRLLVETRAEERERITNREVM